jgi:hypothetical protein
MTTAQQTEHPDRGPADGIVLASPETCRPRPTGSPWRSRGSNSGRLPCCAATPLPGAGQCRTFLLSARPPHRYQDRLRSGASTGPAATLDLAQDDPESGPPVGGIQHRLTQKREPVVAIEPQVLRRALVDRFCPGLEDQVGQLVFQAARAKPWRPISPTAWRSRGSGSARNNSATRRRKPTAPRVTAISSARSSRWLKHC